MRAPVLPRHAVAALFLARQHLDRPRGRRLTAASLERFATATGGVQIDSINAVDRAHLITLWSRFGEFDRAALERLLYRRRTLVEYWAHAACLVPRAHLPAWKRAMADYGGHSTGWSKWLKQNAVVMRAVEDAVRERGPLSSADFEHPRPSKAGGWWDWKPAQHALHVLWMRGTVLVSERENFQKRYDLGERVVPELPGLEPLSEPAFRRWHLERSLHAMGAASAADLRGYLTYPRAGAMHHRDTLRAALADDTVREVAVEGERAPWYALATDLPALERTARRRRPPRGTTLLSPFDSLLWHRGRVSALFGFDYRIEVYVPEPKRVDGYYVLPVLHDGRLIARADVRRVREAGRLEARRVRFEPWVEGGAAAPLAAWGACDTDAALDGLADSLASLGAAGGTPRVHLGSVLPSRLRAPLARAIRRRADGGRAG
jgi:uncharacterized protein